MTFTGIEGKVALVTGAAQGIGEAVVRSLLQHGAIVAAADRNAAGVQALADEYGDAQRIRAYALDVSNREEAEHVVQAAEQQLGPIDILVNVAGILRMGTVESLSDEDWQATFAVNTSGVFHMCRAVIGSMAARESGCIITVSSNAAGVPRTRMSAYAASKAAATMFTKCLGLEYARKHIRCNVVAPGSTDTEMQRMMWTQGSNIDTVIQGSPDTFRLGIPLGKIAVAQDAANAVLFLASDQAGHITMQELYVDGGATMGV
ncbi:2,3-dihydro-2,3-dihydroxybenzoate dehydrogenase [Paenibacillus bovis]|uniref:2,3-dihydro-2,3-dihydroxybenzoate dehydrogenase n=1 Tax=Paenibacillus bovis TaxID=1616788 RepID=A0A172ZKL9_9BACL|nr:2,3-dihydro-2,3-dihydroxybenzoate dehydrogenase [Paenibacillus bovis]ANF98089.1 2,3-dihydro-2,3-dihydroxybenzoate dehydrogenase [Paenibacillus bovis]